MGAFKDREAFTRALRKLSDGEVIEFYETAVEGLMHEQMVLCLKELVRRRLVH